MKIIPVAWLLALPLAAAEFWAAPGGSDDNPGTRERPFATLERARDAVRASRNGERTTVWLRGGVYPLSRSFELSAADSGADGAPVIYRSWPGETARIAGGRRITGFQPWRGKILQADLKAQGVDNFGKLTRRGMGVAVRPAALEVFFQDRPMPLARWPNRGWARLEGAPAGQNGGQFTYSGERPKTWARTDDLWVHGYWYYHWADSYERVTSIDTGAQVVTTVAPHGVYGYRGNQRFRFLNVLEEVDEPGEWYLDRGAGVLYFWPPASLDSGEVWVSLLEQPLVRLRNASYLELVGLEFAFTRGHAIEITGGARNTVLGCAIRNTGNTGVRVDGGEFHVVASCDISEAGDGGITLNGGDRQTLRPSYHAARNNHIHSFSRWVRTYRPAVQISGVGNYIQRNLIHDAPHTAILLSGNNHVIEGNDIHSVTLETGDVGAFYMGRDWTARGNLLRHNLIHNLGNDDTNGIYLDDCASGTHVFGNILFRAAREVHVGGGRDNLIENNIFIDPRPAAVKFDARATGWAKGMIEGPNPTLMDRLKAMPYQEPPWSHYYPALVNILSDAPALPKGNVVRRNLFYLGQPLQFMDNTQGLVAIYDNLTGVDPGFVDFQRNDFRLREDSPAYALGFEPIPMERIGLWWDEFRAAMPAPPVIHHRLELVAEPSENAAGTMRLVVQNLGRVPATGSIELWAAPAEGGQLNPCPDMTFRLAAGEQAACLFQVSVAAGVRDLTVGAALAGSDIAPIGTLVRLKKP
ncbi:MAG: right-handed parallel beta-helix repeat-containing protein [Acidobacteria bacterium]|nr:right-handed parallel beta-helix repeat-containing protein [Acidobacteriota bacterium]